MDVLSSLRRSGSVARTGDLLRWGATRSQIRAAVEAGRLVHVRKGLYALPDAPRELVAALRINARLTCVSAAPHHGLWLLTAPATLHISCIGRSGGKYVNHQFRTVEPHPLLPVVGVVDTLIHVLQCRPAVEAAVVVESSLRRGDTVKPFLEKRLQGNRNGKARAALALVTGCGESALEVVARILFRGAGFHCETQVPIDGVGRVDFILEGFVVVEVDGDKYHSDRAARNRDRRRNNELIARGYLYLRFSYEDIMFNQDYVVDRIRVVLSGRVIR
jgi:very-short-patch-repair endonuclease